MVTGASKGIGRGIAVGLARSGWDVAVNYHHDRAGAEATGHMIAECGVRHWILQADVGDGQQVVQMFAHLQETAGTPRLLVNNAGVQTWAPLLELREEDWDRTIRTNLKGCFLCTQAAARQMRDNGGGSIVNIGSGANKTPFPNLIDYGASKGGIENLTRVAAVELGEYKIRVNCVAPGAIEIERTRQESPNYAGTWGPLTPMGRVGQVEDVAHVVEFLASDKAEFTTGQTIYVDGGLWTKAQWPYSE
jgi:NAD(P)-dependent dehydrogenase (short-subunit alcohol dehydrogenase family)